MFLSFLTHHCKPGIRVLNSLFTEKFFFGSGNVLLVKEEMEKA